MNKAVADRSGGGSDDDEILVFPGLCSSCHRPLGMSTKKDGIPHFQGEIMVRVPNADLHADSRLQGSCACA